MKFVMNRDRTVVSGVGLSVEFKKGVMTHVPPGMYQEVINAGGVPESEIPEAERPVASSEPGDPSEREMMILMAMEQIVKANKREQFTAGGAPHGKALQQILGWSVPNQERDKLWVKCQAGEK